MNSRFFDLSPLTAAMMRQSKLAFSATYHHDITGRLAAIIARRLRLNNKLKGRVSRILAANPRMAPNIVTLH
ncbi:hypothetical protein, partial [Photobacterium halotolerans]|uniref:hypothetical protein n=1 Tax=Photobacterium halotolerans TaxID=265726 RepID=UPI001F48C46E